KPQKVQGAGTFHWQFKDYGVLVFFGNAKQGQSLEQVKDLISTEIEKLKKGDFDETLVKAIVANGKLSLLQGLQKNQSRVNDLMEAFIQHRATKWDQDVAELDQEAQVSKQEIIAVANKYMANNYVLVYKRKGIAKDVVKVEKPPITPVE